MSSTMIPPTMVAPGVAKRKTSTEVIELTTPSPPLDHDVFYIPGQTSSVRSGANITNRFNTPVLSDAGDNDESTNLMNGMEDADDFPDGGLKAWSVVLGAFFGLLADFGLMNSVGAIESYITHHQLAKNSISQTSWIFSVFSFMAYFGGIYAGPIFDKYGTKIPLALGTVLFCVGLLLTGECTTVYQFILAFSVMAGIGAALLMTPLVGVSSHYFLKRRARAIGVASCGGSVGGIISPLFLRSLYPKIGFKWSMRALSLLYFICLAIAFWLVEDRLSERKVNPEQSHHEEQLSTTPKSLLVKIRNNLAGSVDFQILKNPKYSTFVCALFLSEFSLVLTLTYFSSYSIAHGQTESTSFVYITILNASGILGRFIPAYLADRFGRFNIMIIACLSMTLAMFLLWYPFGHSGTVLYAFSVVYGFTSASILSLSPACCSQLVEAKNFGKAYGTAYFCVSFVNLVGLGLGSLVIGSGNAEGYDNVALLASILGVLGTILWAISRYYVGGLRWIKC